MKEQKYWEAYKVFSSQLAAELPDAVAPFGEFVVKWSPFLMLIIVVAKLIDSLFKISIINFLAEIFINLCKYFWQDAFKEPVNKGLITEAPKWVQILFYKFCAWISGVIGFAIILYSVFIIAALLFLGIHNLAPIKGTFLLIVLSFLSLLIGYLQIGYCHQSIKLVKTLRKSN